MSMINVSNLTFGYDGSYDNVFENASFRIDTDWRLGFTGRNGRGKTTFLQLLMGRYPYSGSIDASVNFEYFPFEVSDQDMLTIDVIRDVSDCLDWKLIREANLLEITEDALYRPFRTLSGGEKTKCMLAALFLIDNSFLLIDEPTNHLDVNARAALAEYLKKKSGYILISHDRAFLDGCVDHILSINRANIEVIKGNFTTWWEDKKRRDETEIAENAKLKKEIGRLNESARRTAEWANKAEAGKIGFSPAKVEKSISRRSFEGAKSKKLMSQAGNIISRQQDAIEEKSKLMKNLEKSDSLKIRPLEYKAEYLVEFRDATLSYGDKTVCENVTFSVKRGDRVALCGRNGCGKSTILKLIMGEKVDFTGTVNIGSGLKISYVPQSADDLSGKLEDYAKQYEIDYSLFMTILRKLDFQRFQFDKRMEEFSGGMKKKVLIARSLCESAHLYIWDEPLNFIDVISRMQIEELLKEYKPTILFVEHDKAFCDGIATETAIL